jgi:hypothetical protein
LQHIDAHGKHKGVVGYNKNHGTNALNYYFSNEHSNFIQEMGIAYVVNGYKNPK